ncbi:MAG: hypothetical protein ACXAC7_13220 [Candidatus Hodarchaeales archaeon]|jgi:hypothetical protein
MVIFDELLHELIKNELILTGELINPNYFRISINQTHILFCYEIIRNFGLQLHSISSTNLIESNQIEYFFSKFSLERDFLFSINLNLKQGNFSLPSIREWEPNAAVFEDYIMGQSRIRFSHNNMKESIFSTKTN